MPENQELSPPELPTLEKPRAANVVFVESAMRLREGIAEYSQLEGPIGVDAERASGFKYSNRAYLIQLFRRGGSILLIDPIAVSADDPKVFEELATLLDNAEWVLHAASQDIPCLSELGLRPKLLFDTELAARLANLDRVGLGSSCESLLGLKLAKEHSAVDWSIRPLRDDWLNYAALDVDVLIDLRDALEELLASQGKTEWAKQEFIHATKFSPKAPNPDKWRAMTGLSAVKDLQILAVARELWNAREELAIKLDVSPGRLVPDASLVEAATSKHQNRAALAANRKFAGRASRSYLDTWWAAVERGQSTRDLPSLRVANPGIPNHRSWPQKYPEADARLKVARSALTELAEELNVPIENLISPDTVRQVCWQPSGQREEAIREQLSSLGARTWQIDAIAATLITAVSSTALTSSQD